MLRQNSEGDVIMLTNSADVPTVADVPATVSGFVGMWVGSGVKPGRRGPFCVRQVVEIDIEATAEQAEGSTIYIDGRSMYGTFNVAANSTGAKPFGRLTETVAAGEKKTALCRLANG